MEGKHAAGVRLRIDLDLARLQRRDRGAPFRSRVRGKIVARRRRGIVIDQDVIERGIEQLWPGVAQGIRIRHHDP